jgi:hypothetical protein
MLTAASWCLGAAVVAGLALAGLWLVERPPRGAARLGSAAHGLAGAAGTAMVLSLALGGANDPQGFARMAAWLLGAALLGGGAVVLAQLRGRRPSGLVVAIHATLGIAGFVILLAYGSITH